jgi:hypothetical protein
VKTVLIIVVVVLIVGGWLLLHAQLRRWIRTPDETAGDDDR